MRKLQKSRNTFGIISLITGNADMASALFVVAAVEGTVGAVVVGLVGNRQKANSTGL